MFLRNKKAPKDTLRDLKFLDTIEDLIITTQYDSTKRLSPMELYSYRHIEDTFAYSHYIDTKVKIKTISIRELANYFTGTLNSILLLLEDEIGFYFKNEDSPVYYKDVPHSQKFDILDLWMHLNKRLTFILGNFEEQDNATFHIKEVLLYIPSSQDTMLHVWLSSDKWTELFSRDCQFIKYFFSNGDIIVPSFEDNILPDMKFENEIFAFTKLKISDKTVVLCINKYPRP